MKNYNKKNCNFYYKISSEDNKDNVEIYIGQSCGKQLQNEILSAQKEVLIISPYVDMCKLYDLINLHDKGINVHIAFSKPYNRGHEEEILRKLIIQEKHIDEIKYNQKLNKLKKNRNMAFCSLILGIAIIILSVVAMFNTYSLNLYFLASLPFFIGLRYLIKKKESLNKLPIYYYTYKERIKFKYFWEYNNNRFIHSKIYIIDRRVAYLGSINFTYNGFNSNFETRVRITHQDQIENLVDFVNNIFNDHSNFNGHQIDYLGKDVHGEVLY
ncbi:phospholipase D-like domain-containing protein [Dysgonomonas sp. ZJ279]|uniref:phospholipase D-like domain-containing protein n=1 Tax=Dysgonomonas sp. ZJ279 TaxID=2709796 RepID=UPI0013EAD934|nr:phospholipase D-like domain-containing protein [Dysgonomonas sp. ZJ279]